MSKNVAIIQRQVLTQTLVLIRYQILILILSSSVFITLVIFVSIHDSVKKLFMSQYFQQKKNQYFWCFSIYTNVYS